MAIAPRDLRTLFVTLWRNRSSFSFARKTTLTLNGYQYHGTPSHEHGPQEPLPLHLEGFPSTKMAKEVTEETEYDQPCPWSSGLLETMNMYSCQAVMTRIATFIFALVFFAASAFGQEAAPNTLTQEEKENGWELLFDGESTDGWRGYNDEAFPDKGWIVEDGMLTIQESGGDEAGSGGDIVATEMYDDFILKLEWKISKGGNSGIFYRAIEQDEVPIYWSAPEMQVLDNMNHPDANKGENGNRKAGSLYDLIPAQPQSFTGHGKWQKVKIVAKGSHIEHWLNGEKVVEYELWTPKWYRMIRDSKFECHPEFGDAHEGLIGLQDHGNRASYRNIKIKALPEDGGSAE